MTENKWPPEGNDLVSKALRKLIIIALSGKVFKTEELLDLLDLAVAMAWAEYGIGKHWTWRSQQIKPGYRVVIKIEKIEE